MRIAIVHESCSSFILLEKDYLEENIREALTDYYNYVDNQSCFRSTESKFLEERKDFLIFRSLNRPSYADLGKMFVYYKTIGEVI